MGNEQAKTKKKKEPEIKDIFGYSKNGLKELAGQDAYSFFEFTEEGSKIKFLGVYDGHGEKGKEASIFVEKEIKKFVMINKKRFKKLSSMPNSKDVFAKFFGEEFKRIQASMKKESDLFSLSGSCCICCLIVDRICYVINLGDSRAVIGGRLIDNIFSIQMSVDHKPSLTEEMERIKKQGGEVKAQENGVMRVYKHNDSVPGLAVARTLGDCFGHECGISEKPQVAYRVLDDSDEFIVIGSDGIWDVMNSVEIVGYIYEKMEESQGKITKADIAMEIVEECRKRWVLINKYKDIQMIKAIKNSGMSTEAINNYIVEYTNKITDECVALGEQQPNPEDLVINSETNFEKIFSGKHNIDDITCVICFFK